MASASYQWLGALGFVGVATTAATYFALVRIHEITPDTKKSRSTVNFGGTFLVSPAPSTTRNDVGALTFTRDSSVDFRQMGIEPVSETSKSALDREPKQNIMVSEPVPTCELAVGGGR
jgi:hypothetical protein